ncbi:MAG TPA: radical SAM protein [Patescibacteria group bacterium]|nr:radical SAM protein [Patescibacteria group bacterium]
MVKLILVNAGSKYEYGVHEPLNLLVLAAYAKKFGHDVSIADQIAGENIYKKIKKINPDFVGITATTAVINDAYKIADWCRKNGYKTIIGGVHVSVLPEEGLEHADFVVKGEGEDALVKILAGEEKQGIVTGRCIKNMDQLPKVDRGLINISHYQKGKDRNPGTHLHFVPSNTKLNSILSARGCPFNCIFCHNSWRGLPVRINSAKWIIDEMKELKEKYGTQAVFFMDDDFLISKERAKEFCRLYKEEGLDIIWGCQSRVTAVDEELLKILKEANCKQITFGIESGNQRVLGMLKNNRTTVEQNKRAIKLVKEAGILSTGSFMIGNPEETEEEIEQTKRFIIENDLDGFGVSVTTPFPGTKLWDMCKEKGVIPEKIDWKNFNLNNLTFALSNISPKRMEEIHNDFLNLVMERNPGMSTKNVFKVAIKHPIKAIKRVFKSPESINVFFKKMFKNETKN